MKGVLVMTAFSQHIGKKIKLYRIKQNLTIEDLATKINKSKATVSKYENGSICIDVQTLYEIASVLEIEVDRFVDYKISTTKKMVLPKDIYCNESKMYLYYYDGRYRKIVKSLLEISLKDTDDKISVTMYANVTSFKNWQQCKHLYYGEIKPYDIVTHFALYNHTNKSEMLYITMLNPFHFENPASGLMMAISSNPFAPISIKVIISKNILVEDSVLEETLRFSKNDLKEMKYYNMMMIQYREYALTKFKKDDLTEQNSSTS